MSKTIDLGVGFIPLALPRLIVALGLGSAIVFSVPSPGNSYRPLSRAEIRASNSLDYPQSERSMLNRFGRPLWSDGDYDYYPTHDNGMAQIPYVGNRAQGTRIYQ
jgi:hypothetical protein